MAWMDNTGLYQKFGTEQTVTQTGGEYRTVAALREIEFTLTLASLTTTNTTVALGMDNVFFPAGVRIEQVELIVDTAATSGGAATLGIGLVRTDRTTLIDATAFVTAGALTTINAAGKKVVLNVGSTGAGTAIGTTTANVGHITAYYGTAAFTAGVIKVRIKYYRP